MESCPTLDPRPRESATGDGTMPIRFKCPACKKGLVVRDQLAGKRAACPACKKPVVIPVPQGKPADVEAFAAAALSDKSAAAAAARGDGKVAAPPPAAEPITLTCPFCAEQVKFDADMGGKQAPCPNPECRRIIKVPKPKEDKPRDWREVQSGPSAALANQPAKLEGAWGTGTDKAKVSTKTLEE